MSRLYTERNVAICLWSAMAGVFGLFAGASVFGLLAHALSNPGHRPHSWPGWDLLFYGLAIGLPALCIILAIGLGIQGKLPGTRPADRQVGGEQDRGEVTDR